MLFSYLFALKHRAWERQRVQQQEVTAAYGNRLYLPRVLLNPESESSFLRLFVNCISNDWPFVLGHCSEVDSQLIERENELSVMLCIFCWCSFWLWLNHCYCSVPTYIPEPSVSVGFGHCLLLPSA